MPIGIVIAVAAVLVVVTAVISHFLTVSNLKKCRCKIGNAETKAREIIDDAVKTAEAKKKESLLEIKEESIKNKNELEKEQRNSRAELQRYEKRVLSKEEALDKSPTLLRSVKQDLQQKKNSLSSAKRKWKS